MAKTVDEAFAEFKFRLEITDRQESLVAQQRGRVEKALREELALDPAVAPRVIGSWDRHTLIPPLKTADIDLLVPLDRHAHQSWYNGRGTIEALDRFRAILDEEYRNTSKRRDRNCISLQFAEFRFDVVPAFRVVRPIGTRHYFRIPDSVRTKWVPTNPDRFAEAVTRMNRLTRGSFVPLIKMAKGWNQSVGGPIRSIHLETMLYYHFVGLRGWLERLAAEFHDFGYPWMLRSFFGELPRYLSNNCYEPIVYDRLDEYLDNAAERTNREIAVETARAAAKAAQLAYADQKRDTKRSIVEWRELMGEAFPAYG